MASAQRARTSLESSAVGIHGPVAWVAATLNEDWQTAVDDIPVSMNSRVSRYRYYSTMRSVIDTWVPAVRVVCSDIQSFDPRQGTIQFPVVPEFDRAIRNSNPQLIFDDEQPGEPRELRTVQLPNGTLENFQYTQYPRVSTVDLSGVSWTTATTGIIVEDARANSTLREVSTCVVDARWAQGAVSVRLAQAVQTEIRAVTNSAKTSIISLESYRSFDMFKSDSGPRDSWRRIRVTDEWFNSINLPLSEDINTPYPLNRTNSSPNTTTISALLALTTTPSFAIPKIEHILAAIFADALSRAGSWRVLDITQVPVATHSNPSSHHIRSPDFRTHLLHDGEAYLNPALTTPTPFTAFHMRQEITGYAFKTQSITDVLVLLVVLLHLLIAAAHTLFQILSRQSAACWDSVPELLALALQSNTSDVALRNTGAGVQRLGTFGQRARVRVKSAGGEDEGVELRFDADQVGKGGGVRVSEGVRYG